MISLYLWDDPRATTFAPFALTRPAGELRAGAVLTRERWERAFDTLAVGFVAAAHLTDFEEPGAPRAATTVPAGSVLVNARCLPSLGGFVDPQATRWSCGGRTAAVVLPTDMTAAELDALESLDDVATDGHPGEVLGRWLDGTWDLIGSLAVQLADDIHALAGAIETDGTPAGATVIGDDAVIVERGATVEPLVVFDASAGPILVRRGASISSFTRIVGPCYIGEGAIVLGGRIATASIGDRCKVTGEVSTSIFHSFANKGHYGFVGHSVVGRWANLGAGTTTSNLKNTYGTVQLHTPQGRQETGLQFLGTLFGDHAKTGIGTMLTTGTLLGACANVFGGTMPPKFVPAFAWGSCEPYELFELDRCLVVVERVQARRSQPLGNGQRRQLAAAFARTTAPAP